ncbi:LexA family transcriptional regulator [Pandoraea nosoerga]|nr:LexA family transcriptional regulator [Pandoraea nosoerga]MBN4674935.1 LexA family transcriptional regulator [Pandoraea nosoerga]MBN4680251.1 LexA family transcriptional regulator [Pandoraea nosoerga]MBN4744516.1 LexA family transcriptional regulator [Pandoraea nosoerga]
MNIAQWIRASREAAQLKQDELAERLGKTRGNISAWENGRHEPSYSQILEIARLTKHAVPIPGMESEPHRNVSAAEIGQRKIPLISSVQAGRMTEALEPFPPGVAFEYLLTDLDLSENAFALEIEGQSMEPEFKAGDRIIVDPALQPQPGDFVVAKNGREEATFKKYRPRGMGQGGREVFELVPLNDDYPTINSEHEPARIIGVMVEHRRYRRR